jgi:3-deoxy-7-phosphoheptulonate synthase
MIIVLKTGATQSEIDHVIEKIESLGLKPHVSKGVERTIIGAIGDEAPLRVQPLELLPGVERVLPIQKPYKLVSRDFRKENTVITVEGRTIGGRSLAVMAGPCAVEGRESILSVARSVAAAGAHFLRGGAFKPRTSPYNFQGLEKEGLELLREAKAETGLPIVTELMDSVDLDLVVEYADIIQIGARNMQHFRLLKEVGSAGKPILLKRGLAATIKDLLLSAEYIASSGNQEIILCERGIRTFETWTRNTLDLSAVPLIKAESHLPVIVDPSHGVGKWELVPPMALAAVAAGCDGLMIEVHPKPEEALSDGIQSLKPARFATLMEEVARMAAVVGRSL